MNRNYSEHPWLTPWEQEEVIERLIQFNCNLIKWNEKRTLPLKSGGTTDIYINLRNARNHPGALQFLAKTYRNPLLRLGVDRFVEVPDSVSCFAGNLSTLANLPILTVRKAAKTERVSKAKIIGDPAPNEKVATIDDVITSGGSAIPPITECLKMGLNLAPLVVLVDRQQGWQNNFHNQGISLGVWAGMTLHDVRAYLIKNELMRRCNPALEEKNPLVIALDNKEWDEILKIVDPLRTTGCIFKVNDFVFEKGMSVIPKLSVYGRVLADLKSHDISNTVINTCRRLAKYRPWGVTVHSSGSDEMIRAAVDALRSVDTKVFAVTLLTSIKDGCEEIFTRRPIDEVRTLARIAKRNGAHGLVCSAEELSEVRKICPGMEFLVPALRSPGTTIANDDQARISTPAGALNMGATYAVLGRQVTTNEDPAGEVKRVLRDELGVL